MIDTHYCDSCKKGPIAEECGRNMETPHGEGWFCCECTGEDDISECDMCAQHVPSELCGHVGDMWICCDCEEHVLS